MTELRLGDHCRSSLGGCHGSRYIGYGLAAGVSAMTNDIVVTQAGQPDGDGAKWPGLSDAEVTVASAVVRYVNARMISTSGIGA